MNSDISVMIQLQLLWDRVLKSREEIAKNSKSIDYWRNRVAGMEKETASLNGQIKSLKGSVKQKEVELAGINEKAVRLRSRKQAVKTERELAAMENEEHALDDERGSLEEDILVQMELLEAKTSECAVLEKELAEAKVQADKDIAMLEGKISEAGTAEEKNKSAFNEMLTGLNAQVRPRFKKLIESHGGKAVVRVEGETCGGCNFQIPLHTVIDASKDDKPVNCTHCGRFIYKT